MQYNFDQLNDRRSSDSVKWNYFAPDVLPLWVADMDFVSPQPVIEALEKRVREGIFGYPHEARSLKAAIVDWLDTRFQWKVEPTDIVSIPGVVVGFNLAAHAVVQAGEGILYQPPVYMPFLSVSKNVGAVGQTASLRQRADGSYSFDTGEFESAIDERTRMFLLCSPHNPVGRVWGRAELESMAEISLRHGLTICSDEIHADLVFADAKHIPIAALSPEAAKNTVTLMAPSKTFNIPGLSFSFAVVQDPDLRKKIQAGRSGMVGEPNLLGYVAAEAAYRGGAEWLDQALAYMQANRDFLVAWIRAELPQLKVSVPEGTYLAWIDCREAGITGPAGEFFMKHGRVGFNDGAAFGPGGAGFVRLNFACPRATLVEGLERMKHALEVGLS
jgi:cystathionine beta-lyase